jgi:sulfopyruvate decarboxylase subunit alpha
MAATAPSEAEVLVEALAGAGIDLVASVPDSQTTPLIRLLAGDERFSHVPLTREDDGIGVCAGAFLGGASPCLLIQNSGLLEAYNDLLTLGVASEIPMLLMVGHRGTLGERHWYHGPAGRATEGALDLIGVAHFTLDDGARAGHVIAHSQVLARVNSRPVAVLFTPGALAI